MNQPVMLSFTNGRENNEDSFLAMSLVFPDGTPARLFIVSDGMGGHEHGERFSKETVKKCASILHETLVLLPALNQSEVKPWIPDEMPKKIWQTVQLTWQHIQRMMVSNNWEQGGSTLVLALLSPAGSWAVNIGDSPCFHYQAAEATVTEVSDDHSVAGILLQKGFITEQLARFHEGRHRLEHYIGKAELPKKPCVKTLNLKAGDILLLCSDGVSNSFSGEELKARLQPPPANLRIWAEDLIKDGVEQGETDNQTLICWQIPPEFACITPEIKDDTAETQANSNVSLNSENQNTNTFEDSVFNAVKPTPSLTKMVTDSNVQAQNDIPYSQTLKSNLIPLPSGQLKLPYEPEFENKPTLAFECQLMDALKEPIEIPEGLFLMKTPVTCEQYLRYLPGSDVPTTDKHTPITGLNTIMINVFIKKLNEIDTFWHYRLPHEGEWLAASQDLSFPLSLNQVWCLENASNQVQAVGKKAELENGFYDLFGNVWELMTQTKSETKFIVRGGAYDTPHAFCHPTWRISVKGSLKTAHVGVRLLAQAKGSLL